MSYSAKSIIGLRFERLFVIDDAAPARYMRKDGSGGVVFRRSLCVCDCGNKRVIRNASLTSGATKSCGCYCRDNNKLLNTTHGHTNTGTLRSWNAMKLRCLLKTNKDYPKYGGRGITICNRWMKFDNFLKDMGERPAGATIDRIDNDGHYEPSNCRWATRSQQQGNKTSTIRYTVNGITGCLHELSRRFSINSATVSNRLKRGWNCEMAFTEKIHKNQYY